MAPAPPDGGRTGVPGVELRAHPGADTQGPGGGATGPVEAAAADILDDVAALIGERDEYLGALQRLQADFDNFRKRVLRQQEEQADPRRLRIWWPSSSGARHLGLAEDHLGAGEPAAPPTRPLRSARHGRMLIDVLVAQGGSGTCGRARGRLRSGGARCRGARAGGRGRRRLTETVVDEVLRSGLPLARSTAAARHGARAGVAGR